MNGKRAKRLRARAREYTIGAPDVSYQGVPTGRSHIIGYQNTVLNGKILNFPITAPSIIRVLDPDCTRFAYQELKKIGAR